MDHRQLALNDLRLDALVQSRERLDDNAIAEYADAMAAGDRFPPVVVFGDGSTYWVADGFHRVGAAQRQGLAVVYTDVRAGTRRDAMLYAVGANQAHGLRRTNADKRRAVLMLLRDEEWRQWSDREIARRCGVDNAFVSRLRSASVDNQQIAPPPTRTVERGGTVYQMHTNGINASRSTPDAPPPTVPPVSLALLPEPAVESREALKMAVHHSSETPEHYTPHDFLEAVYAVFGDVPDLDPCAESHHHANVQAAEHYTRADNGLALPWRGRVFVNPPYGREIGEWAQKIRDEWARSDVTEIIALLPARTDTEWFEVLTRDTDDAVVCMLRGRLTFVGNDDPAPFPSLAIYFGPRHDVFVQVFIERGSLWQRPKRPLDWFVRHTQPHGGR